MRTNRRASANYEFPMNDDAWSLQNFSGTARLFPLPNLVLFPHAVQPLHVFEPRYRDLTTDALSDDSLIAMALLQPDWESEPGDRRPIHPVVCLGRVVANQRLKTTRGMSPNQRPSGDQPLVRTGWPQPTTS